jgi:HD-like signal output (HDOD) protein
MTLTVAATVLAGLVLCALAGWVFARGSSARDVAPEAAPTVAPEAPRAPVEAAQAWALPVVEMAGLAWAQDGAGDAGFLAATEATLAGFSAQPQRLPRRPQLLPQLLGALRDEETSAREFAELISRDPTLAGSLLRVANSPVYRLQAMPVESLDRAVALVGTEGLRQLVAVALMQPVMRTQDSTLGALPELLWEHTQRSSQAVAQAWRGRLADDIFSGQLLAMVHGLGAIVVLRCVGQQLLQSGAGLPSPQCMAGLLQAWSPRIGALVAREWELSERLNQALADLADQAERPGSLARLLGKCLVAASTSMLEPAAEVPGAD